MAWEWRENNREKVMEALRKGEIEAVLTSRESALDALAQLACELGVFEAVERIEVERQRAGVPDELVLSSLAILPCVEAMSLSAAANTLFEDPHNLHVATLIKSFPVKNGRARSTNQFLPDGL
jgi:hypothetical protein